MPRRLVRSSCSWSDDWAGLGRCPRGPGKGPIARLLLLCALCAAALAAAAAAAHTSRPVLCVAQAPQAAQQAEPDADRKHSLSSSLVVASLASPPQSCSITQMSSSDAPVASFIISSTRRGATADVAGAAFRLVAAMAVWAVGGVAGGLPQQRSARARSSTQISKEEFVRALCSTPQVSTCCVRDVSSTA